MRRVVFLVLAGAIIGCESLRPPLPGPTGPPPVTAPVLTVAKPPAALRTPVEVLRASANLPPVPSAQAPPAAPDVPPDDDPLLLVARCLERDDHLGAATHLESYVGRNADQPMFRFQLAELYLRAGHPAEARCHYERFVADAPSGPATLHPHLVTAHIKLREIAVQAGDRFGEPFHRGAGLLLLVKEHDGGARGDKNGSGASPPDEAFCEEMLCKALSALTEAKDRRPGDSRVRVYLAEAHDRAGNRHAADAERAAARVDVVSGALTAAERTSLLRE